jgi:TatA/E family protein of Tat protein translocase
MLSFPEILVILLVAVVVLGPKRLPETARKLGRWIGIFKQASEAFKREIMNMDRAVNDSLNRATSDLDQLEPEVTQVFENVEATIAEAYQATTLPPEMTPDDVFMQAPIPGGLASTSQSSATPAEAIPAEASGSSDAPISEVMSEEKESTLQVSAATGEMASQEGGKSTQMHATAEHPISQMVSEAKQGAKSP